MSNPPTNPNQAPSSSPPAPAEIDAGIARTLARHPRPLGGDPLRRVDKPLVSLSGLVLNNQSGAPDQLLIKKKPAWLRAKVPGGPEYQRLKGVLSEHKLHTVCEEANCPNMGECWSRGISTIMILGDTCTRACGFCNVKTGRPPALDKDEPRRVAESMRLMYEHARLKHIVITSVNRDELSDGGAGIWAETIIRTKEACPGLSIEVLIPDFEGNPAALQMVIDARPHIINHNLETVRRMYPAVRPSAKFDRSLELLRRVKEQGGVAKTGIMVGIGERDEEVVELIREVQEATKASGVGHLSSGNAGRAAPYAAISSPSPDAQCPMPDACDILTIGQYLQPTRNHLPIDRWVTPEQFAFFKQEGLARGFKVVESGPLVRSSYHADHQADVLSTIEDERAKRG
ncbi:MAG: lipoyl synthase [Phycisphaerales bacterium]|nr:lipoyl synthase [Phycisphaerales bacterium]